MKFLKYLFKSFFFETLPKGLILLVIVAIFFGLVITGGLGIVALGVHLLGEELFGTVMQVVLLSLLALLAITYVVDYVRMEYKGFKQQQEYKKHIENYKKTYENEK